MLHESAAVTGCAAELPEMIFQRSKRADPSGELNQRAPHHRRQMKPDDPPAPEHQQATEHNEEHECRVEQDDEIGQQAPGHLPGPDQLLIL